MGVCGAARESAGGGIPHWCKRVPDHTGLHECYMCGALWGIAAVDVGPLPHPPREELSR